MSMNKNLLGEYMKVTDIKRKKRLLFMLLVLLILFTALIFRIGFITLVQGRQLQDLAYKQQTLDRRINPKRGTIYDASRKKCFSNKCLM